MEAVNGSRRVAELLGEIEALLKTPQVGMELGKRGLNSSLMMVAVQGLEAYLEGNKARAADDLGTVAEEIQSRLGAAGI